MKKLQQGRSMIEMLGVLAIIGVLSIGGLAGYTMAMNRHRANTILDYVSRCVVVAQTNGDGSQLTTGACGYTGDTVGGILREKVPSFLSTDASVELSGTDIKVTGTATTAAIAEALANRSTDAITITDKGSGVFEVVFDEAGAGYKAGS